MKKYLLSKEELSLYLACTLNPGTKNSYMMGFSVTFPADDDKERIKNAMRALIDRHPILNVRFAQDDNGDFYKYENEEELPIEEISLDKDDPDANDYYPVVDFSGPVARVILFSTPGSYVAMFCLHHIVMDGTARQKLLRDFELAYRGEDIGEPLYGPYELGEWEREQEKLPQFEEDKKWYHDHLEGVESIFPEPDVSGEEVSFGQFYYPFKKELAEKVKQKKAASGVRTSTIFLGAMGYTMAVFAGADSSVLASAMSGRTPEIAEAAGMFVRTLPMISRIRPDRTVDEYLHDLDEQTTGARKHSLFTYMDMSQELDLRLSAAFAYQGDMASETMDFDGKTVPIGNLRAHASDYEMRLYLWRMDGKYIFEPVYRSDHYSEEYMKALSATYEQVLDEMLTAEKLSDIEIISPAYKEKINEFNDTDSDYEKTDIVTLFRRQVSINPDACAVIFSDKKYTYKEVDEISERIGFYLKNKGIKKEDVVSVLIPRCEYMIMASVGVLKSGAAYQPLDPSYPPERLSFMVEDAEAKLVIADRELIKNCLPDYTGDVLYLDEIPNLPAPKEGETLPVPEINDRFIMLYTSGSTGVPKGVILEHGNLCCFCNWHRKRFALGSDSVVAAYASYGFDANMMDQYPTLTSGATVVIIPEEMRLDFSAIQDLFDKYNVTHSFMTTQVARQFAEFYTGHTLKYLYAGGEKLAPIYVDKGFELVNLYGPTECTVCVTSFGVDRLWHRIPIGKPLDNMHLYVVDEQNRLLPPGAPGELLVAGPQVGRGYLNRPEQQEKVFIDNPIEDDDKHKRTYRTGDIVRYLPDGNIDFVGRNDGQVKIRGFRIELPEVEVVIRECPGVRDATVIDLEKPSGGKYLAAYVVSDDELDFAAIADYIREHKPAYMVPEAFMQLDQIPLNQNGKVNRRALPVPEVKERSSSADTTREKNVLEEEIIKVISEVMSGTIDSLSDPLISMGLSSIDSIQVAHRLYHRFAVEIKPTDLLSNTSVLTIENRILDRWMNGDYSASASSDDRVREEASEVALTYPQTGVYYECVKNPGDILYNVPVVFSFRSDLKEEKLSEIVSAIVKAHPALGSHFSVIDGNVFQVRGDEEIRPEILKMNEDAIPEFGKDFVRPFDLNKGPLCRFAIVRTEKRLCLFADFHHLVFDGASMSLFIRDLDAALQGEEIKAEEYSYFDYAVDEKAFEGTEDFEANRKYFDYMLSDFEFSTEILGDLPSGVDERTLGSACCGFDFDKVSAFSREHGVTPAAMLLAASFYTVSRYTNDAHVYLSTISNGRSDLRTADTYGMFVNTLPLGMEIGEETTTEFLKKSASVFSGVIAHEKYPFARIASDYGFMPNIMYEYQVGVVSETDGIECKTLMQELAKFKLSIRITEEDGDAYVVIHYNDSLYSEAMMKELADAIVTVTERMMASPEAPVRSIDIISEEQRALLDSFNETEHTYDDTQTIASMFRTAAAANPDRTAVIFDDKKYSYKEVDDISEKIATYIDEKSLGRGDVVAILIPRGEYMPIASIGATKAGCAYQPLDSTYPPERLNYMVKDSAAKLLITSKELRPLLTEYQGEELYIEDIPSLPQPKDRVSAEPLPEDIFILLYTSGSTGIPKGVRLTHGNLVCFVNWYHRYYELEPEHCVGQYASYGFDACMMDMYSALTRGASSCIIPEDIRLDLNALNDYMEKNNITHQFMTTQMARQFAVNIDNHSLKYLSAGGEKLVPFDPQGAYHFYNGYGPTECTIFTTTYLLSEDMDNVPIGKPLDNLKLYIVDSDGHRLPIGAMGELWVTGPQVGAGYLNQPEKTAEAFIDNPFGEGKAYRTGDVVCYMDDGNIRFVGRRDGQVKIRGFRIELSEVESVIREFPGVTDATVAAFDNESGQGKFMAAYVVSDEELDMGKLRDFISERKPPYMVPSAIMQIDRIPLNQNQKVNVRALPKPVVERAASEGAANEIEQAFCDVFGKVLELEDVGATEDFFAIGGTSILATSALIEAEKAGYELTYQDIFANPTPRELAKLFSGEATDMAIDNGEADYDYDKLQPLLDANTIESFKEGQRRPFHSVLLTGATGYLGVHVLHELIEKYDAKIYCLLRKDKLLTVERRLRMLLFYYFGEKYEELFDKRIFVVEGDITNPIPDLPVDTVVNCAAIVKHFSSGKDIEDANLGGVSRLVDFCLEHDARLVQVSTMSTVSMHIDPDTQFDEKLMKIDEQDLYFGQPLTNKYAWSKFMAERHILESIVDRGLDAKIIRVGNLAARFSDGEFQINNQTNAFMGRLRVFSVLGVCAYEQLDVPMEFSPIEYVAGSVLTLAQAPEKCIIFHSYNPNTILSADVFEAMGQVGFDVRPVEKEEYAVEFEKAEADPAKAKLLTSMLAYRNGNKKDMAIPWHNTFTMQVLYRMGYRWPAISMDYVEQMTEALKGLGFFDDMVEE